MQASYSWIILEFHAKEREESEGMADKGAVRGNKLQEEEEEEEVLTEENAE